LDIFFEGRPKNITLEEVEDIIDFCIKKLIPELYHGISIDVSFSNLKAQKKEGYAFCHDIDDLMFDIELDRDLSRSNMISTLCHELVHIKQFARGELCFLEGNEILWQDNLYNFDDMDYYDYPWEWEAYGREVGLKAKYLEAFNN